MRSIKEILFTKSEHDLILMQPNLLMRILYVLDISGGYGKVSLDPIYYKKNECGNTIIMDYKGNLHDYPDSDNNIEF